MEDPGEREIVDSRPTPPLDSLGGEGGHVGGGAGGTSRLYWRYESIHAFSSYQKLRAHVAGDAVAPLGSSPGGRDVVFRALPLDEPCSGEHGGDTEDGRPQSVGRLNYNYQVCA